MFWVLFTYKGNIKSIVRRWKDNNGQGGLDFVFHTLDFTSERNERFYVVEEVMLMDLTQNPTGGMLYETSVNVEYIY